MGQQEGTNDGLLQDGSGEQQPMLSSPPSNGDNPSGEAGSSGTPDRSNWRTGEKVYGYESMFAEEDRGHPAFEGLSDPKKLGKSYIELKSKIGKSLQPLPEDATPEQRNEFLRKAGLPAPPQSQDDYEFDIPEGVSDADFDWYRQMAWELGLPPETANDLQSRFTATIQNAVNQVAEEGAAEMAREWKKINREWGNEQNQQAQKELANRALTHLMTDEKGEVDEALTDFIVNLRYKGQPARFYPQLMKMMIRHADGLSEEALLNQSAVNQDTAPPTSRFPGLKGSK